MNGIKTTIIKQQVSSFHSNVYLKKLGGFHNFTKTFYQRNKNKKRICFILSTQTKQQNM